MHFELRKDPNGIELSQDLLEATFYSFRILRDAQRKPGVLSAVVHYLKCKSTADALAEAERGLKDSWMEVSFVFVEDVGKETKPGAAISNKAATNENTPSSLLNCNAVDASEFWEFCGFGMKSSVDIVELLDSLYLYVLKQGGLPDEHKGARGSDNDKLYLYFVGAYGPGTGRCMHGTGDRALCW